MKKIVAAFILYTITLSCVLSINAYEMPREFWNANTQYDIAKQSNDYTNVVKYGEQIVEMLSKEPDNQTVRENIISRLQAVAEAYATMGKYDDSALVYKRLYDYASLFGDDFLDQVEMGRRYPKQYISEMTVYTENGISPYYGAKNEKNNGVLFGICSDGETRKKLSNESMVLTYQELGHTLLSHNTGVMKKALESGIAVEFALNCPNEGADIRSIRSLTNYLNEISNLFKQYSSVPVYLRFAAEFDIWDNKATPEEFKNAFIYVSNFFKSKNSNVAVVWSPAQASSWGIDINDYYPGDEYVDWVGISLYAKRYYRGDKNSSTLNEVSFATGVNSDPVVVIKDIIESYGDRKPIMVSESACGHKVFGTGEDTTDFALERLREFYCYLPMVYPQVKLIAYFDKYVKLDSEKEDLRLSTNTVLQNEYIKLTKGERFIQDKYSNNIDLCYKRVVDGTNFGGVFRLATYAYKYNSRVENVTYFINDRYVGMSNMIPFETYVDASDFSGRCVLKTVAKFENGERMTTESNIVINGSTKDVSVKISDKYVDFDQQPIIYNDRTMVPLRKIFESLGATVTWDAETKTAIGKKGDRTVKITVGQKKMYVNSKEIELDTAPIIISARTLVPARAVAEGLGCDVAWNSNLALVSITPKVFKWSEWDEYLPNYVDNDLYYIEEKTLYSYRVVEYFTTDYKLSNSSRLVDVDKDYGSWSYWSDDYIKETDYLDVEERTEYETERYFYSHYCTGYNADESLRYKTSPNKFSDLCSYHELGWFDYPITHSKDWNGSYTIYDENGQPKRCPNSCYRYYLTDTSGGSYTEYRSRPIYYTYTYWQWSDWSDYTEKNPYRYYDYDEIDVDEITVYRYKEK